MKIFLVPFKLPGHSINYTEIKAVNIFGAIFFARKQLCQSGNREANIDWRNIEDITTYKRNNDS